MRPRRPLRILITAGPTREPIDPVRYLSNYSTGYMGAQLATEALARGHRVTVVHGPITERLPSKARAIPFETSRELERVLRRQQGVADVVIMAAAVADFRPVRVAATKVQRGRRTLRLEPTPDIIARLARRRAQLIVGFALETQAVAARAKRKLRAKQLDLLLAEHANGHGAPFGRRPVEAWLVERTGTATRLGRLSKVRVARLLLDKVETLWYGQPRMNRREKTVQRI